MAAIPSTDGSFWQPKLYLLALVYRARRGPVETNGKVGSIAILRKKPRAKRFPKPYGLIGDGWTDGGTYEMENQLYARGGSRMKFRHKTAANQGQRTALSSVTTV